ncbi:MAG: hypothetical protein Q8O99_01810 [bacterium]|nr:hypothetical protein [bacterium]
MDNLPYKLTDTLSTAGRKDIQKLRKITIGGWIFPLEECHDHTRGYTRTGG